MSIEHIELVGKNYVRVSDRVNRDVIIEKRVRPFNDRIIKNLPRP